MESLPDSGVIPVADGGGDLPDGSTQPGQVTLSATTLDFGTVLPDMSATRTLSLVNGSAVAAQVRVEAPSGPNAERFMLSRSGAFEVGANQTVDIEVSFTATATVGANSAAIAVQACESGCSAAVSLVADVALTAVRCDDRVDFGTVNPGNCVSAPLRCTSDGSVEEMFSLVVGAGSDPEITISGAVPSAIGAGETVAIDLSFCPGDADTFRAVLEAPSQSIDAIGVGGGADISCAPWPLDFGTIAVNTIAVRELLCENRGFEELFISEIVAPPGFSADPGPYNVGVGEAVIIAVSASSANVELITGELLVRSNDPDSPESGITLNANVVEAGPCTAVFVPAELEFGLVSLGDHRTGAVLLSNTGTEPCLIANVAARVGAGFAALRVPPSGAVVEPGRTQGFAYTFQPEVAGTSSVSIQVSFVNPMSPDLSALIQGTGGQSDLVATPANLDFGTVAVGCAEPAERTVLLRNTGGNNLVITDVELIATASTGFSLVNPPNTPAVLDYLESREVTVAFQPAILGADHAELHITVLGDAAPTIIVLSGEANADGTRTDRARFDPPKLDLLFVVDDSATMGPAQAALAEAIPELAQALVDRNVDFHFGVVTTDMVDGAKSGRLQGTPAFIDRTTPDVIAEMIARVQPGITGSGIERGSDALEAAVSEPLVSNENAGFLRADAALVVVLISDEDDSSVGNIDDTVTLLRGAAGSGGLELSVITGLLQGNCTGPQGQVPSAADYHALAIRTRGATYSLCAPISTSLGSIATFLFSGDAVSLTADPVPESISVLANGTPVPSTSWSYGRAANRVVFTAAQTGEIDVTYRAFCLSPTCGDGTVDMFESCDDMNAADDDSCTDGCRLALCGDGFTNAGNEACDDGNLENNDACLNACIAPSCGDGYLNDPFESCDDGNLVNGDGCPATCVFQTDLNGWYTVTPLAPNNYVPLANETAIDFGGNNNDGAVELALPFAIDYFGVTSTVVTVSVNGLLAFGDQLAGGAALNVDLPDRDLPNGVLAVWWEDLTVDAGVTGGASVSYEVLGAAPNRTMVVQWRGVRVAAHTTNNHRRFNFQAALFETTNAIELRYGETTTSGNPATATSASAGVENQDGTVGQDLLGCSPTCAGPARPQNANGFPRVSVMRIAP